MLFATGKHLSDLNNLKGALVAAIDDLQAVSAELTTDLGTVQTAVTSLNTEIATLEAQIASLQANGVDPSAVEAVVANLKTVAAGLEAITPATPPATT